MKHQFKGGGFGKSGKKRSGKEEEEEEEEKEEKTKHRRSLCWTKRKEQFASFVVSERKEEDVKEKGRKRNKSPKCTLLYKYARRDEVRRLASESASDNEKKDNTACTFAKFVHQENPERSKRRNRRNIFETFSSNDLSFLVAKWSRWDKYKRAPWRQDSSASASDGMAARIPGTVVCQLEPT